MFWNDEFGMLYPFSMSSSLLRMVVLNSCHKMMTCRNEWCRRRRDERRYCVEEGEMQMGGANCG